MAVFAFALALDANEIQVEMHIQLCRSLSIYRESHLTLSLQFVESHMAGFVSALTLNANDIKVEKQ